MGIGCNIGEIADEYGTPFYIIDCAQLRSAHDKLKSWFPEDTTVAYATKSNYTSAVVQTFRDLGTNFDVFSPGELKILSKNSCDPEKFIYTSVAETNWEFRNAIEKGVRRFVLGSICGVNNFYKAMRDTGLKDVSIMLRVQPIEDVEAMVSTSGIQSKFGAVFGGGDDSIGNVVQEMSDLGLDLSGFHFHLGSQVQDPRSYVEAIDSILGYVLEEDLDIKYLDIGGGYPARYSADVRPIEEFGKKIEIVVKKWREELGEFELIVEPGRFLTAKSTKLVAKVVNIKELYGRKVVILDGNNEMISVVRYGVIPDIELIDKSKDKSGEKVETVIAGNLCHSADWIVKDPILFPRVELGDLLVFKNVGAYAINHNVVYNLRKIPKIVALKDGGMSLEKHPFEIIEDINGAYEI